MFAVATSALLCGVAGAAAAHADQAQSFLRLAGGAPAREGSFVRALQFKHQLRVCNAYPNSAALDVYRGSGEKLTQRRQLAYKECQDFDTQPRAGDKLDFKVDGGSAGTFSVAELPSNDAVLLLVVHRHDTLSTAVSFESHVFANLQEPQIAVIDTYTGSARSTLRIMDGKATPGQATRDEELRYNSAVAVRPGLYEVALRGPDGRVEARSELVALGRGSYVVMRTGLTAQQGESYPQELVVYPKSDAVALHSGAAVVAPGAALLALLAAAAAALAA